MAAGLDTERLRLAFQARPDLIEGIRRAADSPDRVILFNNISSFVYEQLRTGDEPSAKRRRVEGTNHDGGRAANGHVSGAALPARQAAGVVSSGDAVAAAAAEPVLLEVKEISFSLPQRKKFDLCFTKSYLYARASGTTSPVPGIVYAWKGIEHVFYVPVPDKAQLQYNYILFPYGVALAALSKAPTAAPPAGAAPAEPLIFTVPAAAPKPGIVAGQSAHLAAPYADSYETLLHWALEGQLRNAGGQKDDFRGVVGTDPKIFHSAARQAYRPNEKAVHVKAFRGSKDGYLFFLPTGILWGFKKPLLFLPLDRIAAVSYTNVLQRTFNIVVEVDVEGADAPDEVEFGMLDQEDYAGIDESYVRRHGLQDRSMAERRKAKRELAENARDGKRGAGGGEETGNGEANGDGQEDEGLTELQRAEQQLQDEEDEMEEDYDPGSDGDSDGSIASSEEEEEGEEGEEEGEGEEEEYDEDEEDEGAEGAVKEED